MDIKEQITRSLLRMKLARQRIESINKEIQESALQIKAEANFLSSVVVQKFFSLEFTVFMPGWNAFVRLDEETGQIIITHLERGNEKVVLTEKGWSYQPKRCYLTAKTLYPPKDMVSVFELQRFCSRFYEKYGIVVKMLEQPLLPDAVGWCITDDRRFYSG